MVSYGWQELALFQSNFFSWIKSRVDHLSCMKLSCYGSICILQLSLFLHVLRVELNFDGPVRSLQSCSDVAFEFLGLLPHHEEMASLSPSRMYRQLFCESTSQSCFADLSGVFTNQVYPGTSDHKQVSKAILAISQRV